MQGMQYYAIIDFFEVDIRIYLPEKVRISLLRLDKSLCLPKLKSITVLLYDFSFKDICYFILPILKYFQYFAYSLFYAWAIHL